MFLGRPMLMFLGCPMFAIFTVGVLSW